MRAIFVVSLLILSPIACVAQCGANGQIGLIPGMIVPGLTASCIPNLSGAAQAPQVTSPAFSSTLSLTSTSNTLSYWKVGTLTGNIGSFSISGLTAGQIVMFEFTQDATGHRTVASPTGFPSIVIQYAPTAVTELAFKWDGSAAECLNCATVATQLSTAAMPSDTPPSGSGYLVDDSTLLTLRNKDANGVFSQLEKELTLGCIRAAGGADAADSCISTDTNTSHALCGGSPPAFGTTCTGGGGGVVLNTAGQGYDLLPFKSSSWINSVTYNPSKNLTCYQFIEENTVTFATLKFYQSSANSASSGFAAGIYYATSKNGTIGNLVTNGAATSIALGTTGAGVQTTTWSTPPVLTPDVYNFCFATEDTAFIPYQFGTGTLFNLLANNGSSPNAILFTTSTNPATGTGSSLTMPAALGTKVADNSSTGMIAVVVLP